MQEVLIYQVVDRLIEDTVYSGTLDECKDYICKHDNGFLELWP